MRELHGESVLVVAVDDGYVVGVATVVAVAAVVASRFIRAVAKVKKATLEILQIQLKDVISEGARANKKHTVLAREWAELLECTSGTRARTARTLYTRAVL